MTRFRMFGIHLDQFAILNKEVRKEEIGMNVNLNFKYADGGRKVACIVAFDFFSASEKIMVLGITCEFEIQEDWKQYHKGEKVIIPKDLLEFFAVHTIGTARGVLFCKTENTQFNHIVIPPINVSEMKLEDLVVD